MTARQRQTRRGRIRRTAGAILGLVTFLACSEPAPIPMSELVRQGDSYLNPATLRPYSGPVFAGLEQHPQQIVKRARLREGQYDGPFEWYFGNRQLSVRETYREGRRDGPYEWFFENGDLYEKGTYADGLKEGPYQAYYENGHLYERGTYHRGEFDGRREWYLNDRLIEVVTYSEGRIDGPYERYGADGELDVSGTLHDGAPCGVWTQGGERLVHPPCGYAGD